MTDKPMTPERIAELRVLPDGLDCQLAEDAGFTEQDALGALCSALNEALDALEERDAEIERLTDALAARDRAALGRTWSCPACGWLSMGITGPQYTCQCGEVETADE